MSAFAASPVLQNIYVNAVVEDESFPRNTRSAATPEVIAEHLPHNPQLAREDIWTNGEPSQRVQQQGDNHQFGI